MTRHDGTEPTDQTRNQPQTGDSSTPPGMMNAMTWRMASWGLTITGFLGWIFAINAALGNHFVGAGVCLAASAVAFGSVGYKLRRRR